MSFFAAGDYDREMRDAMIQPNLLYDREWWILAELFGAAGQLAGQLPNSSATQRRAAEVSVRKYLIIPALAYKPPYKPPYK
jgi:hypothetical protein